jgi:cyanophycin synthetase
MRDGLVNSKKVQKIEEFRGEFLAIDKALEQVEAGDICLILVDQVDEALAHISQRVK